MKEDVRRRARELGFDECRFTSADAPGSAPQFQRWLEEGKHGAMAYLERNARKRVDPQQVLSGARTIVVLAASYADTEQPGPPSAGFGVIARYARFADYHDVLAGRLKQLASFIDQRGGPETRSLWYLDTGPLLERDFAQRAGLGFVGKHTNLISR
ncbi:MAG: epoxyqueuosine reductase, partial [Limisphaerales bacterium]